MTTGILAIIICAPLGAILMNSFGEKLLTDDNPKTQDEQKNEKEKKEGIEDKGKDSDYELAIQIAE